MPRMWSGKGTRLAVALALAVAAAAATGCSRTPGTVSLLREGAHPGGPDGISVVRAPSGAHVVVNHHPVHVTLELDGAEVGVSENDPGVWLVDGQIIQVAVVPRQAIYGSSRQVSDAQLLLDHLAWESDYVSTELGTTVRAQPHVCRTARGTECLVSEYALESARRNLLITTVVNDHVIALASVVPASVDTAEAAARLRAVLETIMPHDRWIDPAAEAARLEHVR
jgi:hypothetical protein